MVNTVDHSIELISTQLGVMLWVHTIYQPTIFNTRGPRRRERCFYGTEDSLHLKDFQPRGRRWVCKGGMTMTSVIRVAHHVLCDGVWATL